MGVILPDYCQHQVTSKQLNGYMKDQLLLININENNEKVFLCSNNIFKNAYNIYTFNHNKKYMHVYK